MTNLPVYRVDNWPVPWVSGGMLGMMRSGDDHAEPVVMTRAVSHGDGSRSITVTSSRLEVDGRESAWRQIAADRETIPSEWAVVDIAVDGQGRAFDFVARGASWVAVAKVDGVTVTLTARNVEVSDVRLVAIDDPPMPVHPRPGAGSAPRERVLPSQFEPVIGSPSVDLTYRNRRVITGTVGARPVELIAHLPVSSGSARGRLGAATVAATWATADDLVSLTGTFGALPVGLTGRFRHEPDYLFDVADVSGQLGPDVVRAQIERADGGLSTSTIYAEGTVGAVTFSLWAAVDGGLRQGFVRGSVDGRQIDLAATREKGHLRIAGVYEGPDPLLALIVAGLSYFM